MDERRLTVRLFNKDLHERGTFSCGSPAIDRWLRESASDQVRSNRTRLWCASDTDRVLAGFYALAMHSLAVHEAPLLARRRERLPIPAIYLGVLAVRQSLQGRGIGAALLGDALARCVAISDGIGAAAVLLDVLRDDSFDRRKAFYLAAGFAELGNGDPGRLFLPIKVAEAAMAAGQ